MRWAIPLLCGMVFVFGGCGGGGSDKDAIRETLNSMYDDIEEGQWLELASYFSKECREEMEPWQFLLGGAMLEGFVGDDIDIVVKEVDIGFTDDTHADVTVQVEFLVDGEPFDTGEEEPETTSMVKEGGRWKIADCSDGDFFGGGGESTEQAQELGLRETLDYDGARITILRFQATRRYGGYSPASPGEKFIIVTGRVENEGDAAINVDSSDWRLVDEFDRPYAVAALLESTEELEGRIRPGAVLDGKLAFTVDRGAAPLYLAFSPEFETVARWQLR